VPFLYLNLPLSATGNVSITKDYTLTLCITLFRVTIWVNFRHITLFRRNRQNFSPYHAQKLVSQISPHRTLTHSFNQCAWCVPQKSISGAVGATLGSALYKIAIALVSPLQASLSYRVSVDVCIEVMRFFLE
jgi:hypothetical protein